MVVLGIDTSSTDLSVCISVDGFPLSTVNRYVRNSHAEHITQAVKLALELGGVDVKDVTRLAVSVGPGSFTGLRIGLSFIKGFCMMTERKVLPLSSLTVLAHAVSYHRHKTNCRQSRKIFTALDARQGRVHWGSFVFEDGNGGNIGNDDINSNISNNNKAILRRLTDDRLSIPEELLDALSPDDILVADTMGYPRSTVFNAFDGKARIISAETSALSRGLSCAALAFDNINDESLWLPAREIVPNYLQMSAAEEKRSCT